ncbi:cytochrome P450 [Streptomyces fradiae]|uniref:Cytochrome P450 n=1 Tax=Streptomyces sp. IMB 3-202 TaxID=2340947 RepID=A0A385P526_9ACTN|nr:cytochrome P450 [Streptomyces fradiae]AYA81827.1 cytochrome P450 [Streptomyces sp. IMB 3-202]WOI60422.1 cytochrome P450 [Streptomyces fradiae]
MNVTTKSGWKEAPETTMPVDPGPFDCMPQLLAAARVAPVVRIPYLEHHAYVVCDPELVRAALTHPALLKDITLVPEWMRKPGLMVGSQPPPEYARAMIMSDGENHARIRRIHAPVLSPRNTERWGERVGAKVEGFLDELERSRSAESGEVNIVTDYTHRIPLAFISEMLGLPPEAERQLRGITDVMLYSSDYPARKEAVGALFGAVEGWVRDPAPLRDGVITGLLASSEGPDAAVTEGEVVVWTLGMIITGYETTGSLISASLYEALRRPPEERPRTEEEIREWVEETLRVHPPFPHPTWRFPTEDVELGGYLIPKGAPVQVSIAAANRRPGEGADSFDAERKGQGHLSFGLGMHYCIGAPLVRLEAQIALGGFLRRFPEARLSAGTAVEWESEWMIRRLSVLPAVLA